ncbi:MAG: inositol monophosphatase [Fibrobacteres bacterium]|jgi:myo-inositol-1(or 4)-monophosphatase|nr:inositol monophosphatase [Fibrobacterota bacterium]
MSSRNPILLDAHLSAALEIAQTVGEEVLKFQKEGFFVKEKGHLDLVTEADEAAERLIRTALLEKFPEDGFLGEEGSDIPGTSGLVWVVDPIDGTINFSRGHSEYGISIGLRGLDGHPELGVIRFPALGKTYWATRGGGAFCDGRQLQVSSTDRLDRFLVHETDTCRTDAPATFQRKILKAHLPLLEKVMRWRISGAAVHDLCLLAEGKIDVYLIDQFHEWDVLAGWAIVREAGGELMSQVGEEATCQSPSLVFHNGKCGDQIVKALRPTRR